MKKTESLDTLYRDCNDVEGLEDFNRTAQNINDSLVLVNDLAFTASNIVNRLSEAAVEIARLDSQLSFMLASMDANLEKFRMVLPVVERQLGTLSDRIDMITQAILERSNGDMSEENLRQQSILLDTLSQASESFNNMIVKVMMI